MTQDLKKVSCKYMSMLCMLWSATFPEGMPISMSKTCCKTSFRTNRRMRLFNPREGLAKLKGENIPAEVTLRA